MFLNASVRDDARGTIIIKSRAEPSRAEPSRAEPSRAEPSRAEPSRAEPSRAEPSRAEPSRAEPSRAEPSRAEPSRAEPSPSLCPPGRVVPRLRGSRSGRPSDSLPSAPLGAQSDSLPTDPGGTAPPSRRREPASTDRHLRRGHRRFLSACIRRAAGALRLGRAAVLDVAPAGARPAGLPGRPSREPSAARPSRGGALRALGAAVLAATVLLTGLLAAVDAAAQETLWEATMTVGLRDTNTGTPRNSGWHVGYELGDNMTGAMSRHRFTVDGHTTSVSNLNYLTASTDTDGSGASTHLQFWALNVSGQGFPIDKANWVLTVGSDSFRLGDCSGHISNVVKCATTDLSWTDGEQVAVKLTRPSPPQRSLTSTTTSGLIWSATLTPKEFNSGGTNTGHLDHSSEGTLTPDRFRYGDKTYHVERVSRKHSDGDLVMEVRDLGEGCCPDDLRRGGRALDGQCRWLPL